MNERLVANNALKLADELENTDEGSGYLGVLSQEAAEMLRSQERYINQLHKLLNYNGIGAGKDLLTGEVIPFEVADE